MTRFGRLRYCGILSLLLLIMGAGQNSSYVPQAVPAGGNSSMDVPLRLIAEARQSYQGVADYTCLFVKREQINGRLQAENLITMRVRTRPFSVYLYWHKPAELLGQEACYVEGRNNGSMRAHSTGLRGAVGFISIDPRDPRCLENSLHPITEAGIGNLIDRFAERWQEERLINKTVVRSAEYDYDKKRCTRVELIHPDNSGRQFKFYRSVLYFDNASRLPIRAENYDWPRAGSDPNGILVESYSYAGLRLNVNVPAATFEH
jgi:Protein of unknown function (DUF1571)